MKFKAKKVENVATTAFCAADPWKESKAQCL
jgi:hypothetical protein